MFLYSYQHYQLPTNFVYDSCISHSRQRYFCMFSFVIHVLAILAISKAIQCYIYSLLHFCKIFLCFHFVYPLLSSIEQLNCL